MIERGAGASCILWVSDNGLGFGMNFRDWIIGTFERLRRVDDPPGGDAMFYLEFPK